MRSEDDLCPVRIADDQIHVAIVILLVDSVTGLLCALCSPGAERCFLFTTVPDWKTVVDFVEQVLHGSQSLSPAFSLINASSLAQRSKQRKKRLVEYDSLFFPSDAVFRKKNGCDI
jgi:hypothetical protein